jgi:hypothetical protein
MRSLKRIRNKTPGKARRSGGGLPGARRGFILRTMRFAPLVLLVLVWAAPAAAAAHL